MTDKKDKEGVESAEEQADKSADGILELPDAGERTDRYLSSFDEPVKEEAASVEVGEAAPEWRELSKEESRIAIIGGGPAGLCAGLRLETLGYKNVTILEAADRVGGKCMSVTVAGKSFEVGTAIIAKSASPILGELIDKTGVTLMPLGKIDHLDTASGVYVTKLPLISRIPLVLKYLLKTRSTVDKYLRAVGDCPASSEIGFKGYARDDFGRTFLEWAEEWGMKDIESVLAPVVTGFGLGYLNEMSAAQVVKIYDHDRFQRRVSLNPFKPVKLMAVKEGIQMMWEKASLNLDVRLNSPVKEVKRTSVHSVTTEAGTEEFDELILACPPNRALEFMDFSKSETELLNEVLYLDYHVIIATVTGLDDNDLIFFTLNLKPDHAGRAVGAYRRWEGSDIWTFYVLNDWRVEDSTIEQNLERDLMACGCQVKEVHRHDKWDYFPHVSPESFKKGFYGKIEKINGENHTYFTGEMVSSASLGNVMDYSYFLVDRFFK